MKVSITTKLELEGNNFSLSYFKIPSYLREVFILPAVHLSLTVSAKSKMFTKLPRPLFRLAKPKQSLATARELTR